MSSRKASCGDKTHAVETGQVFRRIEDDGFLVVNVEELLEIKDLDVVIIRLAADDDVVLEESDLSPDGGRGTGCLGKASKVSKLATLDNLVSIACQPRTFMMAADPNHVLQRDRTLLQSTNLSKSSTIGLSDDGKLPTVIGCPTP